MSKTDNGTCQKMIDCPDVLIAYQRHSIVPVSCSRPQRLVCCPDPKDQLANGDPIRVQPTRISAKSWYNLNLAL